MSRDRQTLIRELWAIAKTENLIAYYEDPVFVSLDLFSSDRVTFERKQYGTSIVIEAEGLIVERLCG